MMDQNERFLIEALTHDRNGAGYASDLARCLELDDQLEDHGMPGSERITCWTCQNWGNHEHDYITGERIK